MFQLALPDNELLLAQVIDPGRRSGSGCGRPKETTFTGILNLKLPAEYFRCSWRLFRSCKIGSPPWSKGFHQARASLSLHQAPSDDFTGGPTIDLVQRAGHLRVVNRSDCTRNIVRTRRNGRRMECSMANGGTKCSAQPPRRSLGLAIPASAQRAAPRRAARKHACRSCSAISCSICSCCLPTHRLSGSLKWAFDNRKIHSLYPP